MSKQRLLEYLKPYWVFVLLAPICMVLEVTMELLQPAMMAKIVDEGVLGSNMPIILQSGLRMLLYAIIGGIGGIGATVFGSAASLNFGNDLRRAVFSRTMHLSHQQTDLFTTGSLVTRLTNDINMLQETINFSLRMVVRTLMQFGGGIVMLLSLNVNFGLVLLGSMPIQALVIFYLLKKVVPMFQVLQSKLDRANAVVQEDVSGARVIKAYTREKHELLRFDRANRDLVDTLLRVQKNMALLTPVLMTVGYGASIAILLLGGKQVDAGAMQVGDVMAASSYITQILMSMMFMGFMLQGISRAQASARRVREVLQTGPALQQGELTPEKKGGSIELQSVCFHYPTQRNREVLQNISLQVHPGEWLAVLGATGCGKTSLVNLIPRFYDATQGTVLVDGVDVKQYRLEALRARIGFVLQKSELFSGTVEENIRWGKPEATQEEVAHAARIAQADGFIREFAEGYDTYVSEKGASLSGGQKQRVAIARALLRKPEILIFDDSTSALDLTTEAKLQHALRSELADMTVVQIAQRVASVMQADRIAVLEEGTLVDVGTHAELMQRCEIYRDIYDSQLGKGGVA